MRAADGGGFIPDKRLGACDDETALTVVRDTLPVVVERTNELALVEVEPQISTTITTISASVKLLVDAGTPGLMATVIAMSDMAWQKIRQTLKRLIGRGP